MAGARFLSVPRVHDVVTSLLWVILAWTSWVGSTDVQNMVSVAVIDFSDAFHTMRLKASEQGLTAFETLEGYATYSRLPFELASAPLLWGRLAASLCRLGQPIFPYWSATLHCFVDDPAIVLGGSEHARGTNLVMLLLLWSCLGCSFSWGKGNHGQDTNWIGVRFLLLNKGGQTCVRAQSSLSRSALSFALTSTTPSAGAA